MGMVRRWFDVLPTLTALGLAAAIGVAPAAHQSSHQLGAVSQADQSPIPEAPAPGHLCWTCQLTATPSLPSVAVTIASQDAPTLQAPFTETESAIADSRARRLPPTRAPPAKA